MGEVRRYKVMQGTFLGVQEQNCMGDTRVSWKLDMNLGNGRDGFSQSFHCVIGPKLSNFSKLYKFYRVHMLIGSLNKIVFGYQRKLVLHIKMLWMNQQIFYY